MIFSQTNNNEKAFAQATNMVSKKIKFVNATDICKNNRVKCCKNRQIKKGKHNKHNKNELIKTMPGRFN